MVLKFGTLTRNNIANLSCGDRPLTEGGITVSRTQAGDIRYEINVMVDGRRIHRVVGMESDGVRRQHAEKLIEKLRTEAREGRLSLPAGRKLAMTFEEAGRRYLERMEETGGRNLDRKRQQFQNRFNPAFKGVRLDALSSHVIASFAKARSEEGAAPSSVNREMATLSHFLRCAVEWKWLDRSKLPRIPRMKEGVGRITALSPEQCQELLSAAKEDIDPDLWLFVLICLHTSMRHGEVRRIRWEYVDTHRKRIFVPEAKAGEREQPISADLAEVLIREAEARGVSSGYLFGAGPGSEKEYRHTFRKAFRRAVSAAGMDPDVITPHVLRHTVISRLVKQGVDLPTVQKISGHKTLAMVLRYAHVDAAHIDRATDLLAMPT